MTLFDVFFLSHGEANADENWQNLRRLCPRAQRIDGIDGLYQAHRACAEQSSTDRFFVVDADAWVYDDFVFDHDHADDGSVVVWHARNPVNELEYGYGGVKLFPRTPFLEDRVWDTDLSTTIGSSIRVVQALSCETRFNATPESAWIGAFRECAKLASLRSVTIKVARKQKLKQQFLDSLAVDIGTKDWTNEQKKNHMNSQSVLFDRRNGAASIHDHWPEIEEATWRCTAWTRFGWFQPNGDHAVLGARAGMRHGLINADDAQAMNQINDWNWLRQKFQERHE